MRASSIVAWQNAPGGRIIDAHQNTLDNVWLSPRGHGAASWRALRLNGVKPAKMPWTPPAARRSDLAVRLWASKNDVSAVCVKGIRGRVGVALSPGVRF